MALPFTQHFRVYRRPRAVFPAFLEGRFLNSRVTKQEADAQGGAQADPRDLHREGHGECLGRGRTGAESTEVPLSFRKNSLFTPHQTVSQPSTRKRL